MDSQFARGGVAPRQVRVSCPVRGCKGTLYVLQPGEVLGRSAVSGREISSRPCQCDVCGVERTLQVQTRAR